MQCHHQSTRVMPAAASRRPKVKTAVSFDRALECLFSRLVSRANRRREKEVPCDARDQVTSPKRHETERERARSAIATPATRSSEPASPATTSERALVQQHVERACDGLALGDAAKQRARPLVERRRRPRSDGGGGERPRRRAAARQRDRRRVSTTRGSECRARRRRRAPRGGGFARRRRRRREHRSAAAAKRPPRWSQPRPRPRRPPPRRRPRRRPARRAAASAPRRYRRRHLRRRLRRHHRRRRRRRRRRSGHNGCARMALDLPHEPPAERRVLVARAAGERGALGLTLVLVASAGGAAVISVAVGHLVVLLRGRRGVRADAAGAAL
jgi:hypothetical protein